MGEQRAKYILKCPADGQIIKRNSLTLGLTKMSTRTRVQRGSLLEELPEAEQPQDSTKIALVGIDCKSLRLDIQCDFPHNTCNPRWTKTLTRLSDEETNFLLAISSLEERFETFNTRLDLGRVISLGSYVYVSVKGKGHLPGVVWYKGELPSNSGTMFGVELCVSMSAFINF